MLKKSDYVLNKKIFRLAKAAREKLKIPLDAFSILYLGDVSGGYTAEQGYDVDSAANEKTFTLTRDAMVSLAEEFSEHTFTFVVRPHPADPNWQ